MESSQNFHLHISYFCPHPPWIPAKPFNRLYHPDRLEHASNREKSIEEEMDTHPYLKHLVGTKRRQVSDEELNMLKASYFACVSEVDANIGRIIEALKRNGNWENTLIIFTSDHGEQLGDHHLRKSVGFYDESYHLPLIIRFPNSKPGTSQS